MKATVPLRLKHFPISFLAVPLGLLGFTLAYQKAEEVLACPVALSNYLFGFTVLVTFAILVAYGVKALTHPQAVRAEFHHPVKLNFFPILAKLFLIASIILLHLQPSLSRSLWLIGAVLQFGFTLVIMTAWIQHTRFEIQHINPSWFIPVVGSIIVPIAGVEHGAREISWFFFSIGIFWWLTLFTIVINRIVFHHPIANKLVPTLFILFAPPIIGFISLTKLMGTVGAFGNLLYFFGLFLFVLVIAQVRLFVRLEFYLSWWAYSFPLDALVIGTILMYHATGRPFFGQLAWGLFAVLNVLILFLVGATLRAIALQRICVEEA